ncbi:hypothetical protein GR183_04360 [Stappia sp. GBMRC 2046]|uniref:Hemoglobin n=1 Tax=Stappia sediminis TaxID=2692190 RepID=A0A7X3S6R9_9HYPH|nr:hypothetical protein [Stappia sediminis]MXN64125.1 hypothetical protein [Stappia sediminis]
MTLYLRLGGRPALERAVGEVMARLVKDPLFMSRNQVRLRICPRDALIDFLTYLTGGSPTFDGAPLGYVHDGLFISEQQYGRFAQHLVSVLGRDGADPRAATEFRYILDRVRPYLFAERAKLEA